MFYLRKVEAALTLPTAREDALDTAANMLNTRIQPPTRAADKIKAIEQHLEKLQGLLMEHEANTVEQFSRLSDTASPHADQLKNSSDAMGQLVHNASLADEKIKGPKAAIDDKELKLGENSSGIGQL